MNIKQKTEVLIEELNKKLIEREHIIPMILLTLYSKQHMLLLGPPGVGKTYAIELISYFAKELKYFEYLITNDTKLEELFGSKVSQDDGSMAYNIEHSMLDSHICFIDELYKAPSTLLNSLLGVTHSSRSFFQRGRGKLKSPMVSMFAASNELPENDAVDAFDDRILFRFWVDEIKNPENFKRYTKRDFDMTKDFSVSLSTDELNDILIGSKDVAISDKFVELYSDIRIKLGTEKVRISDRKLQSSLDIFQTSAFINGRKEVNLSDLFLLLDIAWKHYDDIERVKRVIFDSVFGNPSYVLNHLKQQQDLFKTVQAQLRSHVSKVLNYTYNFNGTEAELEFISARENLQNIANVVYKLQSHCQELKDNYNNAEYIQGLIQKNIFIPDYINHIYQNGDIQIDKRVSKTEIFQLSSDVDLMFKKLTNWLNATVGLYEYNNLKYAS